MKNLFTLLIFCFFGFGYSQDTINVQSLPQAGFTYVVSNDTVTNYAIPIASTTHQSWDYSNLVENYPKVPTYDSTSKTSYATIFPTSNLYTYGPAILYSGLFGSSPVDSQGSSNGHMFWLADSTGFWVEGFRPDNGISGTYEVHNQPHELLIPLPGIMNEVTHNVSSWQVELNVNPADMDTTYITRVTKRFEYDAFGELKTPYGNYTKVLRLHEFSVKVDSIYAHISGYSYPMELSRDTTNTYFYLDKDTDYPVMTMYADAHNTIKYTEYFKMKITSTMAVNDLESTLNNKMYPNPFTDELFCETINEGSVLKLMTMDGKLVKEYSMKSGINHIDVSDVETGLYLSILQSLDGKTINYFKIIKR